MKGVEPLIAAIFIILISIAGAVIVLQSTQPSVDRLKEISLFEESKNILTQIDNAVRTVSEEGQGSTRILQLSVSGGDYIIDAEKDAVVFSMDSRSQIVGIGISKNEGSINMLGEPDKVLLNISYSNINVTGSGSFGKGYHSLIIKNNGYDPASGKQIVSISTEVIVTPITTFTVQYNQTQTLVLKGTNTTSPNNLNDLGNYYIITEGLESGGQHNYFQESTRNITGFNTTSADYTGSLDGANYNITSEATSISQINQYDQDGSPFIAIGNYIEGFASNLNALGEGATYNVEEEKFGGGCSNAGSCESCTDSSACSACSVAGCSFGGGIVTDTSTVAISTREGTGQSNQAWTKHVFFDSNNNRWHVFYIDSNDDIHTASTGDGTTWVDGTILDAGTYHYDDFDCELDVSGANTYLHCVYSNENNDYLNYRRCQLTEVIPYISCGTEETPFDSSLQGGDPTLDDVAYPRIALDSNRCVLIAFGFEDDSEVTADEWEVVFLKEASSTVCGDGDWDGAGDTETGFPIYSVQEDAIGYNNPIPIGLKSFGDLDAQVFWIDTDSTTSADLETIFFSGTSNSFGTQGTLDNDVEWTTTYTGFSSVIIGEKTITFAMDDGTTDLDAYTINVKNGPLVSQIDTGMNVIYNTNFAGVVKAVVDTKAPGGDDIWVFGVNNLDNQDIYYIKSTDGGNIWQSPVLWVDEGGINEVKYLSANFNNETCDIMVRWLDGSASPFTIHTKAINTGSCGVCSGTLDCPVLTESTCTDCGQCYWTNPTYKNEIWHNSSTISYSGSLDSVNVTINFTTTQTDVYSLQIYDWSSSYWDSIDCDSGTVLADTPTRWWCNKTSNPENYISSDGVTRIKISSLSNEIQGILNEDYIQYFISFTTLGQNNVLIEHNSSTISQSSSAITRINVTSILKTNTSILFTLYAYNFTENDWHQCGQAIVGTSYSKIECIMNDPVNFVENGIVSVRLSNSSDSSVYQTMEDYLVYQITMPVTYRMEVEHNVTGVSFTGTLNNISVLLNFSTTSVDTSTFNFMVYNFNSGSWENCGSFIVSDNNWHYEWCNETTGPENYLVGGILRFRLNETSHQNQADVREDYNQYYVTYTQ